MHQSNRMLGLVHQFVLSISVSQRWPKASIQVFPSRQGYARIAYLPVGWTLRVNQLSYAFQLINYSV